PLPNRDAPSPRLVQLGREGMAEQDGRPRCDPYPRKATDMGGSQPYSPLVFGMVSQRLDHQVVLTSINKADAWIARALQCVSPASISCICRRLSPCSVRGRLSANIDPSLQTSTNVRYRQPRSFDHRRLTDRTQSQD